ncbi:hypothetical protein [Deinococcus sp. Leaf326]|uniref:hypothetical protein n=1 Tax=Deinococcus sp. Leaf326 TaxID=1736338 RepID=UPI0006FF85E0|nr:hypothetical protein [Deinococcus sp. Leaf326]KQR18733.1 hypothetical protein ASF71_20160 [Deinococcus sp. Leaf326]
MQHLSLPEIPLHLGALYERAGLGLPPNALHRELADFLGCHREIHAAAWALWATELQLTGRDLGGWLDDDFFEAVPVE